MSVVWWRLTMPQDEDGELGVPHYFPVNDFIEHEVREACVCGPTAVVDEDETDGGVVAFRHHPLDESQAVA